MTKKKRKPRVYNWISRGYRDALANTPYKHAPAKNFIEQVPRENWTPEMELYADGFNSAKEDLKTGKVSV